MIAGTRALVPTVVPDTLLWKAALVVVGSLVIALSAQVAIPLPGILPPVSGQTFGVLLVGATLGSRLGFASVVLYLIQGAVGLPVFTPGGLPGVARFGGPTGGYLVGFAFAAFAVGWLAERGWDRRLWTAVIALLAGEAVIYAFGLPGLARFVPLERVLELGLYPFILGDLYKLALVASLLPLAWRVVRR